MYKIIIHDNKSCQIITDDADIFRILRSTFSYKIAGVEYSIAYKNGWNGITFLINKKGFFFSGLINKVIEFLKDHKINPEIEDLRKPVIINPEMDLSSSKRLSRKNC